MILIYILYLVLLIYVFRHHTIISPVVWFVVGNILYSLLPITELIISGDYVFFKGKGYLDLAELSKHLFTSATLILGFLLSYNLGGRRKHGLIQISHPRNFYLLVAFVVLLTLVFVVYFRNYLAISGDYRTNYTLLGSKSVYAYSLDLVMFLLVIVSTLCADYKNTTEKILHYATPIILVTWALYTSNKNPILLALLPLLYKLRLKINWRHVIFLLPLTFLGLITFFSLMRKELDITLSSFVFVLSEYGIFRNTDPSGPMYVYSKMVDTIRVEGFEFGKTYSSIFWNWIPSFVWPDRWLDPAVEFAVKHIPNRRAGQGYGYSFIGEAWYNFGVFGGILQGFLLGGIWRLMESILSYIMGSRNYSMHAALMFIFAANYLVLLQRNFTVSIFKDLLIFILPMAILLRLVINLRKRTNEGLGSHDR
jgi:hypothetical protein